MTAPPAAPPRSTASTTSSRSSSRHRGTAAPRVRSAAVQRAYERRAQRAGVPTAARQDQRVANRARFVVLVMVLLSGALVATLWLSTAAAADSYRLEHAREVNRDLTEHSEQLGRDVASMETAPELARRAVELGMVPAGDPARLVVGSDGAVAVVGKPKAATAPVTEQPAQAPASAQLTANGATPAQPEAAQPGAAEPAATQAGTDVPAQPAGTDVPAQLAGAEVPAQPGAGPGGAG